MVPNLQPVPGRAAARSGDRPQLVRRLGTARVGPSGMVPALWPVSRPSQRVPILRARAGPSGMVPALWPVSRPSQRVPILRARAGPSGMVPNLQTVPGRAAARSGDRPQLGFCLRLGRSLRDGSQSPDRARSCCGSVRRPAAARFLFALGPVPPGWFPISSPCPVVLRLGQETGRS